MLLDPGLGEFEPGPGSMASDCMSVGTDCGEWRELKNGEFREHKMKACVVLRSGCNEDWGPPARVLLVDGKGERFGSAGTPLAMSVAARLP